MVTVVAGSDAITRITYFVPYANGGTTNVFPRVRVGGICSTR